MSRTKAKKVKLHSFFSLFVWFSDYCMHVLHYIINHLNCASFDGSLDTMQDDIFWITLQTLKTTTKNRLKKELFVLNTA